MVDDIVDGFRNTWVTKIIKNPTTVSKPNLVATTGCFAITSTVCDDKKLQEAEDVSHVLFFRKQLEQII